MRKRALILMLSPLITSRVGLSTPGWSPTALMPNGLLLPGGIDAPHALSTAHCATVTEAGTVHLLREAIAASATSAGTSPKCPVGTGRAPSTKGLAASA